MMVPTGVLLVIRPVYIIDTALNVMIVDVKSRTDTLESTTDQQGSLARASLDS